MDDKQNKAPWYKRTFLWGQTNLTEDDPKNVIWISGLIIGKKQGGRGHYYCRRNRKLKTMVHGSV